MFVIRIPRYWRSKGFRYRLEGYRCEKCGHFHHSPRLVCRKCGSRSIRRDRLSQTGRLISYTVVKSSTPLFEQYVPYVVGVVKMVDGSLVVGQVTDCDPEELREDMQVEVTLRKIRVDGENKLIQYGYKFRPVIE
ncbi:MAG TPA: Zn-ribbon domain-containing OB-fold protein [Candidatus Caldiarchaeum subterraneum]|uniref:Zn-ribbon domain-containing OB-fold protein n=1 Tax=Caldiarchaeum subterraneum TaxID=311458 RepID=A0A832ZV15_CALS0|nr:Zn-ribbon domain-containing OB-fold protein [Aigarchaeota archaeon]HIQ29455.1 Zn-ribbon domain-containing OB-fold protein [Candidatus Caldarchaeum subterraneum]